MISWWLRVVIQRLYNGYWWLTMGWSWAIRLYNGYWCWIMVHQFLDRLLQWFWSILAPIARTGTTIHRFHGIQPSIIMDRHGLSPSTVEFKCCPDELGSSDFIRSLNGSFFGSWLFEPLFLSACCAQFLSSLEPDTEESGSGAPSDIIRLVHVYMVQNG